MRYEVARKVYDAFSGLHPGLTVEVTHNGYDHGVTVTARQVKTASHSISEHEIAALAVNDDGEGKLCDLLMRAAEKAIEAVINGK